MSKNAPKSQETTDLSNTSIDEDAQKIYQSMMQITGIAHPADYWQELDTFLNTKRGDHKTEPSDRFFNQTDQLFIALSEKFSKLTNFDRLKNGHTQSNEKQGVNNVIGFVLEKLYENQGDSQISRRMTLMLFYEPLMRIAGINYAKKAKSHDKAEIAEHSHDVLTSVLERLRTAENGPLDNRYLSDVTNNVNGWNQNAVIRKILGYLKTTCNSCAIDRYRMKTGFRNKYKKSTNLPIVYLDSTFTFNDGTESRLMDILGCDDPSNLESKELLGILNTTMQEMMMTPGQSDRLKKPLTIWLEYHFAEEEPSMKELGKKHNVSEGRVSQILGRTSYLIKAALEEKGITLDDLAPEASQNYGGLVR